MSGKVLSQNDIIKIAAEAGARAALETLEAEKKKNQKTRYDRRLRNTKLLLRNYRVFKEHVDNAVFDMEKLEEKALDILDVLWSGQSGDLFVESIKESSVRTKIIMTHIEEMLKIYSAYCSISKKIEDKRRYRIIYAMYIQEIPEPVRNISEREKIDKRTVYKDVDAACETLAGLIFGVDGIKGI